MARLRKAARQWRDPRKRALAGRVLIPDDGPLFQIDPASLFGTSAPLEADLGAGRGDFIIDHATAHPEHNFLAVELAASVARVLAIRAGDRKLDNLRVARMDARTLINLMLPMHSLTACHVYFPDPWPALSQRKHRLFSAEFVKHLKEVLAEDGTLYVATDVEPYAHEIFEMLDQDGFRQIEAEVPGAGSSGFARKYLAEGRRVFSAAFALPPGQSEGSSWRLR
jgi:tRNA (guanine-N7-)-methyltransferase